MVEAMSDERKRSREQIGLALLIIVALGAAWLAMLAGQS
jgi:hypothetical protein